MANPTTYFGWVMPTATDLVTDLPADFNVFGQGVDTSMQDLLGGTTGQILSKASNTNMDFTWITNDVGDITAVTAGTGISGGGTSGAVTVTNSMATAITTAGDLIKGTGSGTFDRLGIGSTGQVLTVTAGAPAWATPAGGGGKVLQVVMGTMTAQVNTTSTSFADIGLSVSITPSSASSKVLVLGAVNGVEKNTGAANQSVQLRLVRASTTIQNIGDRNAYTNTDMRNNIGSVALGYLDSPATTSATTYKVQSASQNSGVVAAVNAATGSDTVVSTIIVLEIGA
jgi:hypothetical protein